MLQQVLNWLTDRYMTSESSFFLLKLKFLQLMNKLPVYYETRRFILLPTVAYR
jgi:hypothetical protein